MKKHRATRKTGIGVLAISALAVSLLAFGGPQAASAFDYATITGTVTADDGGAPLTYPRVELFKKSGTSWNFYTGTWGGRDGTYHFTNVPTGTYTMVFAPQRGDNFVIEWWNDRPDQATATTFAIDNTVGNVSHIVADASLATGATISGTITAPPGTSFTPDPDVSLLEPDTSADSYGWDYQGLWAYPAEDGSHTYKIVGIPPGTYAVRFDDDATASDLTQLYYRSASTGSPNIWDASSITLTAREDRTGVDGTFIHGATVTGKVTDYAGAAISGVTVTIHHKLALVIGDVVQWSPWPTTSSASGTFKMSKMIPGTWTLDYSKAGYTTVKYLGGATFSLGSGQLKAFGTVKMYKKLTASTPTISGTKRVGYKLTASHGTWTAGTGFSYAWYANGAYISGSSGPTHSTFTLTTAQRGKTITVKVTGKKTGYTTLTRTSAATVKIL